MTGLGAAWITVKNSRHTNVLLVSIFENALKIAICCQKCHFGRFWQLFPFFKCIFKNIDQNNICASTVFKAITEKKILKKLVDHQKTHL